MKKFGIISLAVALMLFTSLILLLISKTNAGPDLEWTMINVNQTAQQGDAHLIRIAGGKTVLIDAGHRNVAETSLIPFLVSEMIDSLDIVFISHPHPDHYGGLRALLENGIEISEVYFNLPIKSVCDKEIPWGCNYQEITDLFELLKDYGVPVQAASPGQDIRLGKQTRIDILYAFDGLDTPVGETDVNDLSLIMMMHHKRFKFLFTGDLNWKIGGYLDKVPEDLSADVLKVPHHGAESAAPNSFLAKVSPGYAMVPAPRKLWLSDRSARMRKWFGQQNIPVFVNGLDGEIRVAVEGDDLYITAQKNMPSS